MKANKILIISIIISAFFFINYNIYSQSTTNLNCKCENCSCEKCICSSENCKCSMCNKSDNIKIESKCKCESCNCNNCKCEGASCKCTFCTKETTKTEKKCECENCNCEVCKCGSNNAGSSSDNNAQNMVKSLLSSLSNNYENISGNIRERCCHKSEIDGMNSISDSNLVCIVSKETIKSNPERFTYLGKEYTFCSKSCIEKFKSEPLNYIKEGLVCPVMGDEINPEFYTIHNGIKYYFCCKGCIKKFKEAPEKYINGYQEN